jgi:hypothetical protein
MHKRRWTDTADERRDPHPAYDAGNSSKPWHDDPDKPIFARQ